MSKRGPGKNMILIYDGRFRRAWILNQSMKNMIEDDARQHDAIELMNRNTAELAYHILEVLSGTEILQPETGDMMYHLRLQHFISSQATEDREIAEAIASIIDTIISPPQATA